MLSGDLVIYNSNNQYNYDVEVYYKKDEEYVEYLKPLIGEDVKLPQKNGLPNYLYRKGHY